MARNKCYKYHAKDMLLLNINPKKSNTFFFNLSLLKITDFNKQLD